MDVHGLRRHIETLETDLARKAQQLEQLERARVHETQERERVAAMMSAALDALPAHVALLDQSGAIVGVNRAWRSFAAQNGFEGDDGGVGTNYLQICEQATGPESDEAAIVAGGLRRVLAKQSDGFVRRYACHAPGNPRWFQLSVTPLAGRDAAGAIVMHLDVGKVAADALRSSEERFAQLAENIQEVFWMRDARHDSFLYVSPAFDSMWGRSSASVYESPRAWFEAIHPDDRDRVATAPERVLLATGALTRFETTYRIIRPDGAVRWIRDRSFPVASSDGSVHRIVGTATDITEQRELEEQFRHAQKMESVGRLAGGIAHDFNNLLTVINGLADLLLDGAARNTEVQEDLETIRLAGDRAARLTQQLLALSRQQMLKPEVVNLEALVGGLRNMLQRLLGEDVALMMAVPETPWLIKADPGQVEQVVLNLAINARDAMPEGGTLRIGIRNVHLDDTHVAVHPRVPPGAYVQLSVSDTGVGMDEATRERIFEPFFTTKPKGKGTGLGLSTVYGIVEQSGGGIWFTSTLGKGSTCTLYLPRVDATGAATRQRAEVAAHPGVETVLLVEDETMLREFATRILEGAGYTVHAAANADEALQLSDAYDGPIHLLLTDVVMPGVNGRALAEQVCLRRPDVRVLYMSGYTDDAIVRHGVLEDAKHFVGKPYTPTDLRRKVREVLDA